MSASEMLFWALAQWAVSYTHLIKYLANERSSDPKVVGIISNGYPHRSLGELGLENKYLAYYATKMALWCYLLPNWNINNLKVAPGLTGAELERGQKILAAAKDIYKRGKMCIRDRAMPPMKRKSTV